MRIGRRLTILSPRYINANAERLRPLFVSHEGKLELAVVGDGDLYHANYPALIDNIVAQITQHSQGIRYFV